ncbi:WASH complex subunit 2A, partial [Bulinus truncatus]
MAASAPPTGVSIGESGGDIAQNGPRLWERAWTTQEMRKEAGNWSLAGDAGLLQYLQKFSQHIISRTHEIGKEVDGLVHDAKLTGVRVNNVINDFIMLANTQFVENRVFDEDVSHDASKEEEKKTENKEKTREQREAELIPRVSNALKLGIDVIDHAFEKLDTKVDESESEEEEPETPELILEPKDPYANRLLPFLIGTPQFMEDDNVGLTEDVSDEGETDQGSISVSSGEESDSAESETETEYSTSEDEPSGVGKKDNKRMSQRKSLSHSEESDSESDDNEEKDDEEDDNKFSESDEENNKEDKGKTPRPGGPIDFASELAAKLGGAVPKKKNREAEEGEADDWEENSGKISSANHNQDKHKHAENKKGKHDKGKGKASNNAEDDLFGPSEGQDDDFLFGNSKGLFQSGKGLFDDDEENEVPGGLFDEVVKSTPSTKKSTSNDKPTSIFEDDDEEVKEDGKPVAADTRPRTKSGKVLPKGAVSVFGIPEGPSKADVSDTHVVKKPTPQPAVAPQKKSGGLFDDEEDEDDLFSGTAPKKAETQKKEKPPTAKAATSAKKSDLFTDDDDDLFSTLAAPETKKKSHSTVGLTVEGYDEEQVVEGKKQEAEQLRRQTTPEKKLPAGAVSMFGKEPNPLLAALKKNKQPVIDDESETEEDKTSRSSSLRSNSSTTATPPSLTKPTEDAAKKGTRTGSIFDDGDEDDDLFTKKPSTVNDKKKTDSVIKSEKSKPVKDTLFNDGDDSDDDFFSPGVKPAGNSKKPAGSVSLFGGVDVLGTKDNKDPKPSATATPSVAKQVTQISLTPPSDKKKSGASLFDEDEDDDDEPLFSAKPQKSIGDKNSKKASQGLFEDNDLLFKAGEETSPAVDLFGKKGASAKSVSKDSEKKATPSKPVVPDLFGEDNEDDDLFSSPSAVKPHSSTSSKSAAQLITGVTDTESSDIMEVKEEEVKKPKKPAGAVSMFGGMDPTALLKKRKPSDSEEANTMPKVEVKEESEDKKNEETKSTREENKETEPTKASKASASVDLFDEDDDENDDLFAPKPAASKKIEGVTTSESNDLPSKEESSVVSPTKPRKPAGAVSMFGGGIDPFAILKKNKKPSEEEEVKEEERKEKVSPPEVAPKTRTRSEATEAAAEKEKAAAPPEVAQKAKTLVKDADDLKPKPPVDLFGGEDEEEDDLFGAPKKKSAPPPTAPKSAAPLESPKEEPKSPEPSRPKKPAGAVSMFGGLDPFAAMKKKSPSVEEKEDTKETSPPAEEPPNFIDPLSVLASPVASVITQTKPTPPIPSASPKLKPASPVKVAHSAHFMSPGINPAALLPGASHPSLGKALERSESVDFDQPAEAEILASASKDRPKLNRRRPQSRKARIMAAGSSGISFEDSTPTSPTAPAIPEVSALTEAEASEPPKKAKSGSPDPIGAKEPSSKPASMDLFGNDDLIEGPSLKLITGTAKESSEQDDIFSKDSFGSKSAKEKAVAEDLFSSPAADTLNSGDSLLNAAPAKPESAATKSAAAKKDISSSVNNQVDDDLFKASAKAKPSKVSPVLDDDDDLFSSSSLKKGERTKDSKTENVKDSEKNKPVVDISSSKKNTPVDDEEEDIFADSSLGKKKETKQKKSTLDDDLFGSKNQD